MSQAPRDENQVPSLLLEDDVTGLPRPALTDADGNLLVTGTFAAALNDLTDVVITNPQDGDVLTYDSGTGDWINEAGGGGGGGANTALSNLAAVAINTSLLPGLNDGAALGGGTLAFSDVFLASGGVINFNNANYTITHSAGDLAFSGIVTLPNNGLHILDTNASHDLIIAVGSNLTADRIFTVTTGDAARTLSMSGNITTAANFTTAGANNLTLTTTGVTNVTLPTTGTLATLAGTETFTNKTLTTPIIATIINTGTVTLPTATDTLVARATTDTLTNKTISGVSNTLTVLAATQLSGQVPLANGGTAANLTDPGADRIMFWDDSAGVVTWLTAGSGLTITDTTITASGGTARRNLNPLLNINNLTTTGTAPTNSTTNNGVQCSVNSSGGASSAEVVYADSGTLNYYDNDIQWIINVYYAAGPSTGSGDVWFGDVGNVAAPPTATQTTKSCFVLFETTAGTTTAKFVTATGAANQNTTLASIDYTGAHTWRIVQTGASFECYYDGTLKATHATNVPSGSPASDPLFEVGVKNDGGDSTTRTATFGWLDMSMDL